MGEKYLVIAFMPWWSLQVQMESIYELERLKVDNSKLTTQQCFRQYNNTVIFVKTKIMIWNNIETTYFDRA